MKLSPVTTLIILAFSQFCFAQTNIKETSGIWKNVQRDLSITSLAHQVAIACHNCYHTDLNSPSAEVSTKETLAKIENALLQGADFIELDIVDADGEIRVKRKDTQRARGALLTDVLSYEKLRSSDAMLYLEIKEEKRTTDKFMWTLLNELKNHGYAKTGRPAVIRVFPEAERENFLLEAKNLLDGHFKRMKEHVLLSLMLPRQLGENTAEMTNTIERAAQDGIRMVEFNYRTKNIAIHLQRARDLGLGIGMWTLPAKEGNTFIAAFRDQVDLFNTDSEIVTAQSAIEDHNLLYSHQQSIPDSAETRKGYLVMATIQLTELEVGENATHRIVGREKGEDFTLEIHNPGGSQPTMLRFGVKANRQYKYAYILLENLNVDEVYTIVGAYNGDGAIELFVNQDASQVTTAHTRGKVAVLPQAIKVSQAVEDAPFELKNLSVQGWGKWK
ncbi:MAG: hypothetical protein AB8G22_10390 [Saprospiraceae bacterium]